MNSLYITLSQRVAGHVAKKAANTKEMHEFAQILEDTLKNEIPLTGALSFGSVDAQGNFNSGQFPIKPDGSMNFDVRTTFTGDANTPIFQPVVRLAVRRDGRDFRITGPTGGGSLIPFAERHSKEFLIQVTNLFGSALAAAVDKFEQS